MRGWRVLERSDSRALRVVALPGCDTKSQALRCETLPRWVSYLDPLVVPRRGALDHVNPEQRPHDQQRGERTGNDQEHHEKRGLIGGRCHEDTESRGWLWGGQGVAASFGQTRDSDLIL